MTNRPGPGTDVPGPGRFDPETPRRVTSDTNVINVVLYRPENPHNTGGVVRTCALLGARLHLVAPYGFAGLDGDVRRSSMSYLDVVDVVEHRSWEAFVGSLAPQSRVFAFWDEGATTHDRVEWVAGDYLLFGRESVGLPAALVAGFDSVRIAMPGGSAFERRDRRDHSLNVSVSVGIAVAEANRQLHRPRAATPNRAPAGPVR